MRAREFILEDKNKLFERLVSDILKIAPDAYEIWFYGSRARGDHRPSSDYDILVIIPDAVVGGDFLDLQLALEKLSAKYNNFDVQASHSWNMLSRSAREEGRLIWKKESLSEIKISGPDPRVKSYIDRVYAKFPSTWQNNHVMSWGKGDEQQLAIFELVPSLSLKGAAEIKWFQAHPLRSGVGSRAIQILQQMAQEDGIALTLYPWDRGQISQAKLIKFYRQHGFRPAQKGSKNLVWEPKQGVAEAQTAKAGIVQTEVYGTRAYHAKCLEPGCDWESRRYDKIQQAQAAAKKHSEQHFAKKQGLAEGKLMK
jgi:predicted nucleotidyltransferase